MSKLYKKEIKFFWNDKKGKQHEEMFFVYMEAGDTEKFDLWLSMLSSALESKKKGRVERIDDEKDNIN